MCLGCTHAEGRFGADAMNKGAGNIWIVCLPLVHSDSPWLRLVAAAEFPYHRRGAGLNSRNVGVSESEHAPLNFSKLPVAPIYIHNFSGAKAPTDKTDWPIAYIGSGVKSSIITTSN